METQGVTKTDRFKAKSRETHPNIVRAHGNERRVKFVSNDIQDMGSADLRIGQSSHVYVVIHGSFLLCLAEYATSDECCHHVMLLLDRRSDVLQYPSIKETVEIDLLLWLTIRPSLRRDRSVRSEEHTSELQSRENLVCRLLLEKKKSKSLRNNTTA